MEETSNIVVAMSGGVDSSVAAALLLERGHSVRGMILKLWTDNLEAHRRFEYSVKQAAAVADQLHISFEVIDATEQFREQIIHYFLLSHRKGLTPNPCFVCNQKIKWGLLLEKALQAGANYVATGHYAQIVRVEGGNVELHKGCDHRKDQSYILAGLTQEQLSRAILPLGDLNKEETRRIAHRYGFINSDQPDSQDLCFLGDHEQKEFLSLYAPVTQKPGDIFNTKGERVGSHGGLANYTIGQRKGLGSGFKEPIYVIGKDVNNNSLTIGYVNELGNKTIVIEQPNWISGKPPSVPLECSVKIRYKARPVKGTLVQNLRGNFSVVFDMEVRDATPGQIAVLYEDDLVIGSGVISQTHGEKE